MSKEKDKEVIEAEVVTDLPDANKTSFMPITPNAADEFKDYDPTKELVRNHRLFCEHYITDPETKYKAVDTYMKLYPNCKRSSATANVTKLLSSSKIRKYLRFLNLSSGFSDEMVDSKLKDHIFNGEDRVSIQAIRHYNQLMGRITEKKQVTTVDANKLLDQLNQGNSGSDYN